MNNIKYGLPEIYKYYREKMLGTNFKLATKERKVVTKTQYKRIHSYKIIKGVLRDFNNELSKLLIEDGAEFKMPVRLGSLRIKKYKRKIIINEDGTVDKKRMSVNWRESKELWKREYPGKTPEELKLIKYKPLIYYLNEHTDGYRFLLFWNKIGSNAKNRGLYSFIFTSVNNRYLARVLQSNHKPEYYE